MGDFKTFVNGCGCKFANAPAVAGVQTVNAFPNNSPNRLEGDVAIGNLGIGLRIQIGKRIAVKSPQKGSTRFPRPNFGQSGLLSEPFRSQRVEQTQKSTYTALYQPLMRFFVKTVFFAQKIGLRQNSALFHAYFWRKNTPTPLQQPWFEQGNCGYLGLTDCGNPHASFSPSFFRTMQAAIVAEHRRDGAKKKPRHCGQGLFSECSYSPREG